MVLRVQELGEVGQGAILEYVGFTVKQTKLGSLAQLHGRVVYRRREPPRKYYRSACLLCKLMAEFDSSRLEGVQFNTT